MKTMATNLTSNGSHVTDVTSYLASFPGHFPPLMWPGYEAGCDVLMVPYHTQLPEVSTQELYADSRLQVWAITGKC